VLVEAGETPCDPLVASVPVQLPLAVHEVAFVLDQVRVELPPDAILAGFAVKVIVGCGVLVDVTVTVAVPVAVL